LQYNALGQHIPHVVRCLHFISQESESEDILFFLSPPPGFVIIKENESIS